VETNNNKRIVDNTLFLYLRMLISMGVSLYTSRIVLQQLGISDYGLYNVIGGVVAFLSILKSLMSTGVQRFLTFEMGQGASVDRLSRVFSTSMVIFLIIGLLIILVGESIGLWFVNNKLVIASGRLHAANVVYQITLISMLFSLIQLPYTAAILAHERMDIYGYVGLCEPLLKLGLVFLLPFLFFDKLIVFSIINLLVCCVITLIYIVVCKKHFKECIWSTQTDKVLFKNILSFTSWNLLESFSNLMSAQGLDILLNMFFGTTVNAARAVAVQAKNSVHGFATNFLVAMSPQITKYYASKNYEEYYKIMIRGAKFSYIFLAILMIPLIMRMDYLLSLWLGTYPDGACLFARLILVSLIVSMVSEPLYTGLQATGKIKNYQIFTSCLMLLNIPLCYVLFAKGAPAYVAFIVSIFFAVLLVLCRLYFISKITEFPVKKYLSTILNSFVITIVAFIPIYFIDRLIEASFLGFCSIALLSVAWSIVVFSIFSLKQYERSFIVNLIKSKIRK